MDNQPIATNRRKMHIGFGVVLVLVLIGIVITVWFLNRRPKLPDVVEVSNYTSIGDVMPNDAEATLRASLYYLLAQHFEVPSASDSISANVRIDTLDKEESGGFSSVSFITDIDEYQQTYRVSVSWSDSSDLPIDVLISCTRRDVSKYPDSKCYGMYNTSESVELYLPYEGKTSSGHEYSMEFGFYNQDDEEIVNIYVKGCGEDEVRDEAIASAREYIKSIQLDSKKIEYKVSFVYDNCLIK